MLASGSQPRLSPGGDWMVFVAPVQGTRRLWRMRLDGSARAPIGRGVREELNPAISPDGRFVAYVAAETEFRRQLYLRRFDGLGELRNGLMIEELASFELKTLSMGEGSDA